MAGGRTSSEGLRCGLGSKTGLEVAIESGVVGLGDEDGKATARVMFAGELVGTAAEGGPFGKAGGEPGGIEFVRLMAGLEDLVAGYGESFGGKVGVAGAI